MTTYKTLAFISDRDFMGQERKEGENSTALKIA